MTENPNADSRLWRGRQSEKGNKRANTDNGEKRIQQLEQELEIERQKYRIISCMVK